MTPQQQAFLDRYLTQLTAAERDAIPQIIAEHFCDDEYNANECARLIDTKVKRASCSLKQGFDIDDEPLPEVGRLSLVLDWAKKPVCIVKLTQIKIMPFNKVTPEFTAIEGEGYGSYAWWHQAHVNFFSRYAANIGATFNDDSDLVLEWFEKVY